jgi:hypothetical protein
MMSGGKDVEHYTAYLPLDKGLPLNVTKKILLLFEPDITRLVYLIGTSLGLRGSQLEET